ncbi:MAG: UDP binding domain-containing protein, partial [Candidatus Dormibacteria bacterium]
FPKDTRALDQAARQSGYSFWMLKSAMEVNELQRMRFVHKLCEAVDAPLAGRRVTLLGLSYKPGTDDLRQAPSIDIALRLQELGAEVTAHDPVALEKASEILGGVRLVDDPFEALRGADAVGVITEWPQYIELDWARVLTLVRRPVVVDGRNCLDRAQLAGLGFDYHAMGRPSAGTSARQQHSSDRLRGGVWELARGGDDE